jgi:heterodisulfide reductase subunit C
VDCAAVIDILRQVSLCRGEVGVGARRTVLFQQAFLENVRRHGRICELELVARFKTRAFLSDWSLPLLMKDALLAPKMLRREKFQWRGQAVQDRAVVQRIFDRCFASHGIAGPAAAVSEGR